jgi:hypothetical protein
MPRCHPIHSAEDHMILNLIAIWLLLNALFVVSITPARQPA